jgi:hypothetical protein
MGCYHLSILTKYNKIILYLEKTMNDLLTFEDALTEAKKEKSSPKNKVGKAQSYFKKDWTFKKGNHYTELKDTKPLKADGFVAGENSFIIDKEKKIKNKSINFSDLEQYNIVAPIKAVPK